MRYLSRHINWWFGGILMLLPLLLACASGPTEEIVKEKPKLKIYLFAPDHPIVTRGDVGNVDALSAENAIKTLDIWVFENISKTLVGYMHLADQTFDSNNQKVVVMDITDEYAAQKPKPSVDIYVVANATASNSGLTFSRNTTPTELEAATFGRSGTADFFGLTSLVSTVPDDGLPMSGLLKEQTVDDSSAPVYSVAMTTKVKLVRAVSKVRFILSKSATNPPAVSDLSIQFDDNMVPTNEYLFLSDVYPTVKSHVDNSYENGENNKVLVTGIGSDDINDCTDPASYEWRSAGHENETAQGYETRINNGMTTQEGQTDPDLSEVGCFYLRESDKRITGTISYKLDGVNKGPVPFEMAAAYDFTRNHTWIVYGYFLGSGELKLNAVYKQPWTDDSESEKIHNW